MFRPIKYLAFSLLPIISSNAEAWVIPPQFGIFSTAPGEEPDVVAVTYVSDWNDPAASTPENYRRLTSNHDGLMIRNDMVLVNSPPADITAPQVRKYSVVSEMVSSNTSLPISKIHSSGDFNILELGCRVDGVDLHEIGFGEITHRKIENEGIAATIYFRDGSNNLKRSVQPLFSDNAYGCNRGPDFCLGYLIEDWADQVRNDAPHGSPVFYIDDSNSKKIIGLLKNDRWLRISGGYRGKPRTYYTHLENINSLEDFIVSTTGVRANIPYEWVEASTGTIPKGSFRAGQEGSFTFNLCTAEFQGETYPGHIGQQLENTEDTDHPAGCVVSDGQGAVEVIGSYSALRGRPDYDWVSYPTSMTDLFEVSGKVICRQADTESQRPGWMKTNDDMSKTCIIVGRDGAEASADNFEVLVPASEKPICTSSTTSAPQAATDFVRAGSYVASVPTTTTDAKNGASGKAGSALVVAAGTFLIMAIL